jgi:hypothetical protein
MNTYLCTYIEGAQIEVSAETTHAAQLAATELFQKRYKRRKVHSWYVDVRLTALAGEPVVHKADS